LVRLVAWSSPVCRFQGVRSFTGDRRGWFLSPVCAASARPSSFVHSRSRHPFKRVGGTFTRPPVTSRWSPVDSHFFDLARPVALVATASRTASVRLCLPRGQTGAFCRPVALVVARSLVTSPQLERARRFVRSLLVTRPRDLLSNGVVSIGVGSLFGPVRCLRARRLASRAFSIRSPRARGPSSRASG
jgi:hypothetical protein